MYAIFLGHLMTSVEIAGGKTMIQRKKSQSIGLLMIGVFLAVLLWALAAMVQPSPVAYADDPPPPQIETITVTSSEGTYFYSPGLGEEGGTVYFNSVGGEGAGQVLAVTVTCSGTVTSFEGAPAFGSNPLAGELHSRSWRRDTERHCIHRH
jgi:hypothetical protein